MVDDDQGAAQGEAVVPDLAQGDLYLYTMGSQIIVTDADDRREPTALETVIEAATDAAATGHRVFIGGENTPESVATLTTLGQRLGIERQIHLEPFVPSEAPLPRGEVAHPSATRSARVEFPRRHLGMTWGWLAIALAWVASLVLGVLLLTALDEPGAGLVVLAVGVAMSFVLPPPAFWFGGAPRALDGTLLTYRGYGGSRTVDLAEATLLRAGQALRTRGHWVLVGHAQGRPIGNDGLRRLMVAKDERDRWRESGGRVIVLHLYSDPTMQVERALRKATSPYGVPVQPGLHEPLGWR